MSNLDKIKFDIQEYAFKHNIICDKQAIKFLTAKQIKEFSKEELKEIWLFAKVRFITIHFCGKNNIYELNKNGELVLI